MQGMLTHNGSVAPVLATGIDPEAEQRVSIIGNHMQAGSLEELREGEFGIVIGELIARRFGVQLGDKLTFVMPEASVTPAGVYPRIMRFLVVVIVKVVAGLDALSVTGYVAAA